MFAKLVRADTVDEGEFVVYFEKGEQGHTDGQRMIPTGPSPRTKGSFFSSSRANMMSGRQNANVFPEPVNAMPIISRPVNLQNQAHYVRMHGIVNREVMTYATGIPCI